MADRDKICTYLKARSDGVTGQIKPKKNKIIYLREERHTSLP